jgi:AraC-like DNA-binding protein
MAQAGLSESVLKKLFKEALTETLHEQRELLHDVFAEVLEDIALAEAIRQGQQTEQVAREDIFRSLEGNG